MPSVHAVVRTVLPRATRLGADQRGEGRAVSWVRVMRARVPAFDALEAGDLAIVPQGALSAIAPEPPDAEQLADQLARAGVAGVLLLAQAEDPSSEPPTPAVGVFLDRLIGLGLPVFRQAGDEGDIERGVIGYLVNERAELDRQVGRLEVDVQAIALQGRGLAEMAAAIGAFARRAVAIEDPDGAIVALHAPPDLPASTVLAARYERRRGPIALRVGLPGGGGALVLLGDDTASDLETAAVGRVAVLVALELARGPAGRRRPARATEGLPAGGPPWVVLMARQVLPDEGSTLAEREERRQRVTRLAPARRLLLRGDATSLELRAVAAAASDDPLALELAARIAQLLGRPVAASRPFDEPSGRPAADAEARALLEAADEVAALEAPPAVLRADRLALYRLLASLHNLPDGERHARALLAPLLSGAPRAQRERLATLRSALDGAGPAEAAAALGVHRNTIRYRLRAMEQRTGWDLDDAELRFVLSLALRLVQRAQE